MFIKPGNLSQYEFLMQWKSIFLSSADDLGTKSKQSLKETNVSNALHDLIIADQQNLLTIENRS